MIKTSAKSNYFLIFITYMAFISLGLPDGLLGIAWPYMSKKFQVPLDSLGLLLIGFTAGYLSTSTISGKIMTKISLGVLLTISCAVTGLSLLTYAYSGHWYLMMFASFFLGTGGGAIDSSINTFAASHFNASVVNWLHAFYGIGATSGPLIITLMISNNLKWHNGYTTVAVIQLSLAAIFLSTQRYWKVTSQTEEQLISSSFRKTLRKPVVWINVLLFFIYTGLEVGIGQWIFTILTKSRGLDAEIAGLWTSAYWGSLTAGRIVFGILLTKIPVNKVLIVAFSGIVTGTVLLFSDLSHVVNLAGIIIAGIANAPVFPSLISLTSARVGKEHTANAIGLQVSAAMTGGALIPGFAGLIADYFGIEVITFIFVLTAIILLLLYLLPVKNLFSHEIKLL